MKKLNLLWVWMLLISSAQAADLYWKGGSGNFNDPNMWWEGSFNSGQTAFQSPISTDNVFFPATAFVGSTFAAPHTITANGNINFNDMWWDPAITAAQSPIFTSASNASFFMDSYGHFELTENIRFQYRGNIRFRATNAASYRILTGGQNFMANNIRIDGACGVEYVLQDDFSYTAAGGRIVDLVSGVFNTNGKNLVLFYFDALGTTGNFACRGLILDDSRLEFTPNGGRFRINFNTLTGSNNVVFSANNTEFLFSSAVLTHTGTFQGGIGTSYGRLISLPRLNFNTGNYSFEHIELNRGGVFAATCTVSADTVLMAGDFSYTFAATTSRLHANAMINTSPCNRFVILAGPVNSRGFIRKRNPNETLFLDRFMFVDMEADPVDNRLCIATNSLSRGGTPPVNIQITSPNTQAYFFRNRGDRRWLNPLNWDVWDGIQLVPNTSGCAPSAIDDVYFDDQSFTAAGERVQVDSAIFARHMRWLANVTPNTGFEILTPQDQNVLRLYGTMQLSANMHPTASMNNMRVVLAGRDYWALDSVIVPGQIYTAGFFTLGRYADYEIIGDGNPATVDWHTLDLRCSSPSRLRASDVHLRINSRIDMFNRVFHNTYIEFPNASSIIDDDGGTVSYTGNTTVHARAITGTAITTGGNCRLPNVISEGFMVFANSLNTVMGDLRLNRGANLSSANNNCRLDVTGTMALYDGNVYLAKGFQYRISSGASSRWTVAGYMRAIGDCQKSVRIFSDLGSPVQFTVQNVAGSDFRYLSIEGLNASASPMPLPTYNSVDNGNNSNWNFLSLAQSQTYYWRAHSNNPTNYIGNWSNPAHWTLDPLSPVGDSACLPTALDTVVFDSLSFGGTLANSGCTIDGTQACATFWMKANVRVLSAGNGVGTLIINESLLLDGLMSNLLYSGTVRMEGSGIIRSAGTHLPFINLVFNKIGGVWHLTDDLYVGSPTANATFNTYGRMFLFSGTIHTNNHYLYIRSYFTTDNLNVPRRFNLGQSTVDIACKTAWTGGYYWYNGAPNSFIDADSATLNFLNGANGNYSTMLSNTNNSAAQFYKEVHFQDPIRTNTYAGRANVGYATFLSSTNFTGNHSFDSLYFEGGNFYRITAGRTITLNAPHGKIIANGSPGSFVNIESSISGSPGFFYKAYGSAFCLDFVKVKDNEARKETNLALVPAAWQALHHILRFETGVNSDNIGGTATGIWDFSLPILYAPTLAGGTNIELCSYANGPIPVPIQITGTSPYIVNYTWTDNLGNAGARMDTLNDDDNNPFTAYTYWTNFSTAPAATQTNYSIQLATLRCGELTPAPGPVNFTANLPNPAPLVAQMRSAQCELRNDPVFHTFVDQVDKRPILSVLDKVNTGDMDALGLVEVDVNFDASVQSWAGGPYLPRHWRITPQNNGMARVRVYFTEQEMEMLRLQTFVGSLNRRMRPDTELRVRKFESGILGLGPSVIIPHDTLVWTAATTAPFTTVNGLIGFEFEVPSFSYFIIEPTDEALLSLQLESWQVQCQGEQAQLNWRAAPQLQGLARIERADASGRFETLAELPIQTGQWLDEAMPQGTQYYRLAYHSEGGTVDYSPIRSLYCKGQGDIRFEVFPNPKPQGRGLVIRSSGYEQTLDIRVYDALGRLSAEFLQVQPGQTELPLNLPGGWYYLQARGQGFQNQRSLHILD